MKISVLIPTYNRADILGQTLEALVNQSFPKRDFEVIVVDDGSTEETPEILEKFKSSDLHLKVMRQKNSGQGAARNRGLHHAVGQIVILIGDDTVPIENFLKIHWEVHQKNPGENVVVLGRIDWHPDLEVNEFMNWMVNGSSILGKFGGHQFAYEKLDRGETPNFNFFYTSNLSLKRNFLGKDPFDLSFSKYGWEDIELGYRLEKEKGMKMIYEAKAITHHYHPMDESGLAKRMTLIGRSAHIIDQKYPELHKVPRGVKKVLLQILSNPISLGIIRLINWVTRGRFQALYYYALSKKYFLIGIKSGII